MACLENAKTVSSVFLRFVYERNIELSKSYNLSMDREFSSDRTAGLQH